MKILAIESSCDETATAVVEMDDGKRQILSSVVASQIEIHKRFGGVVPEVAGRAHIECIARITRQALEEAGTAIDDIDAVAVTARPGLIGALLVGVNFAKSLAYANGKPLVDVDHIRGHVAAAYLAHPDLEPPFLAMVASGGHTSILDVRSYTDFVPVAGTRDDAVGEAFDKAARVLGIPYPGGAEMDRLAESGDKHAVKFPSPALDGGEFSFSGLKTAVVNYVHTCKQRGVDVNREDVAASFTHTVCDGICRQISIALDETGRKSLVLAGGVAANSHLRASLASLCERRGIGFYVPPKSLCGDNAAMIGAQAYYEYVNGVRASTSLNAFATDEL